MVRRDASERPTQVTTTDTAEATGGIDHITTTGGTNIVLGGVGGDVIDAPGGQNIVLGDNGQVNLNNTGDSDHLLGSNDIFTTDLGLGGNDVITAAVAQNPAMLGGGKNPCVVRYFDEITCPSYASAIPDGSSRLVASCANSWAMTQRMKFSGRRRRVRLSTTQRLGRRPDGGLNGMCAGALEGS